MNYATRHMSCLCYLYYNSALKEARNTHLCFYSRFQGSFVGGFFEYLFALTVYKLRRSIHVPFQRSPSQSNMSAYRIVIENGCYGVKKGSQFQPLSNCTFRLLTPVLAGHLTGYLARAVHKDGNAK